MMTRRRIIALERLLAADKGRPTSEAVVADCQRLDKWLASIGMTARQALDAGLTEPPQLGLRWTSVALMVQAHDRADAYLRERLSQPQRTNLLEEENR